MTCVQIEVFAMTHRSMYKRSDFSFHMKRGYVLHTRLTCRC